MTWSDRALFWLADALTALYAGAVGATLGSFVNVVVYRLPRRMSLSRPGSRCPACDTPIRLSDNLPVVGWLRLHGKCRACGGAISARYPLVEAAYGLLFAALLFADVAWQPGHGELVRGGYRGVLLTLWSLNPEQIAPYLWHVWLFSLLGIVALLEFDRQRIPRRIVGLLLVVGLFAPQVLPGTRDVHFDGARWMPGPAIVLPATASGVPRSQWALALLDGLLGMCAGGALGLALLWAVQRTRADARGAALGLASGALGLYYGWQTVCGVAGVAAVLFLCCAVRRPGGPLERWPTGVWLAAGITTAWARPWLAEAPWWPGPAGDRWTAALWASGAAVCTLACGCLVRVRPPCAPACEFEAWQPVLARPPEASTQEPTDATGTCAVPQEATEAPPGAAEGSSDGERPPPAADA